MTLTPTDAALILILAGKSEASAIRPGDFTATNVLDLVARLQACAGGK